MLYAMLTAIPQLIDRIVSGRLLDAAAQHGETVNPPIVTFVGGIIAAALVCASLVVLGRGLRHALLYPPPLTTAMLAILLSIGVFHHFAGVNWQYVVVSLVAFAALSTLNPDLQDLRIFAHVGAFIAAGSILFGQISADAYRYKTLEAVQTKAIIGHGVLAGPYPSSNNLGMGMAMALPFAFLIRNHAVRRVEIALMALALVLSASRSSLIAIGVAVFAVLVLRGLRSDHERAAFYWFGMATTGIISLILPWLVNSPSLFTGRGAIWMASRQLVRANPLAGVGETAYFPNGAVQAITGTTAAAGHNILLHYWVVGGFVGFVAMAALLIGIMRAGRWSPASSLVPGAFVFVLLALSIDEMPLHPETVVGEAWIAVPAIAVLLTAARKQREGRGQLAPAPAEPIARGDSLALKR
ncbi:MAG TPA: O-antigen ligase family protein [Mycobacteriales bacterium]|nr:O-antigen ligase family protein [Mycobacteriales bacterium]